MLRLLKTLYSIANVLIIFGMLSVHFVLKERSYLDALRFYAMPLPIIIVVVFLLSIFLRNRRYNIIIAGILLVIWLGRSFKIHIPESIKPSDLEVVFWNASRDNGFEEAFKLIENIPDVCVLVESKRNDIKLFQKKYPNYYFYKSDTEIYIFSKSRIEIEKDTTSNHNTTVINFKSFGLNFYAIDVSGSTDVPRTWELGFVNKNITTSPKTMLLGDFNVPFESINLKEIKANFNHAFNEKGNGFRETWFWNIPLLSLDHIWASKDLEILKTEKINTFKSDHCLLKTYIRK
ncbi:endonuclease/exonuclease/phosphatase family protein [Mariniflexile sp.]|uniref:endonuclease/exonuclease/phosphatase family protein n=1 Tax=Mariniflexile sp. TaxID=1979402 RepID=UPI00356AD0D5